MHYLLLTLFRSDDVVKAADWKLNLKIPPKDQRIRTAVSVILLCIVLRGVPC